MTWPRHLASAHQNGNRAVVLDLRGLDFLDSTGVRLLLHWHKLAQQDGFEFAVVAGSDGVQRPLDIAGVTKVLRFVDPPSGKAD